MKLLPEAWTKTTLGACCEIVSGATPSTKNSQYWGGGIAWITPDDLSGYKGKRIAHGARSLTDSGYRSCSARLMPPGAVLFTSRAPIGYVAIASGELCTNQGFKSLIPGPAVTSDFLYWHLRWAAPTIREMGTGTTFKEVNKKVVAGVPISYPGIDEQRRLVEMVEDHFSHLDAGLAVIERVKAKMRHLEGALLHSAMTFDESPQIAIDVFASVGSGATPLKSKREYYEGGDIPWVTSGQLVADFVEKPTTYITERAVAETAVKIWPRGTLLVAMYGEGRTRGHCSELAIDATTNQACAAIVLRRDAPILSSYLKYFFKASYDANRRLAAGGVQPNLSLSLIKSMKVPCPSLEKQARAVNYLDSIFASLKRVAREIEAIERRAAALRLALLDAVFGNGQDGTANGLGAFGRVGNEEMSLAIEALAL